MRQALPCARLVPAYLASPVAGAAGAVPALVDAAAVAVRDLVLAEAVEDLDLVAAHEVDARVGAPGDQELDVGEHVAELGLGDESDGIMELPADAGVGQSLVDLLELPDAVIDVDLTPNRGDCFSVLGIARDVSALTGAELRSATVEPVAVSIDDIHPVELVEPDGCPRFAGRLVKGIDPQAASPLWMVERLRRAGLRGISPVVDVTNYVMLELGQPIHGYDGDRIAGGLGVRRAGRRESLQTLDGRRRELDGDDLVITAGHEDLADQARVEVHQASAQQGSR